MGLNAISKKSALLGKKSKRTFLQVNKYDNAPNAMELIGHICTAAKDIDFNDEFTPLVHHLFEMEDECKENDIKWNQDIEDRIIHILQDELEKSYFDNTFELKIAVAGGYSAGKSTFMNMLIGNKDYLPTDMNPTSLVNTFLNFSQKIKRAARPQTPRCFQVLDFILYRFPRMREPTSMWIHNHRHRVSPE